MLLCTWWTTLLINKITICTRRCVKYPICLPTAGVVHTGLLLETISFVFVSNISQLYTCLLSAPAIYVNVVTKAATRLWVCAVTQTVTATLTHATLLWAVVVARVRREVTRRTTCLMYWTDSATCAWQRHPTRAVNIQRCLTTLYRTQCTECGNRQQ